MITNDPSPLPNTVLGEPPSFSDRPTIQPPTQSPFLPWLDLIKGILTWIASVLCLAIVPIIVVVPYLIYLGVTGGSLLPEVLTKDKTLIFLSILGVIPAHLLTLGIAWAVQTNFGRIPFWQSLKFSWPNTISPTLGFVLCAVAAFLLLGVGAVVTYFAGGGKTDLDLLIESSSQARIATVVLAVFTAPLVEEVIYRGILYPRFQRVVGMVAAVLIVSIMFAGVHVFQYRNNIGVIIVISVLSLALTLVRALTDRLLPSVIIHLIFNGVQSVILVLQPYFEKPPVTPPPTVPALIQLFRHLI